jgi:CheY-like chemotaxis protein
LIEVHANTLDVILLDIDLPGMNGYQMLKRLQDEPRTAAIPVLALSANAMPNDIRRGLAAGFLDYLVKPIEVPEFLRILDGLLEQRPTQPKT